MHKEHASNDPNPTTSNSDTKHRMENRLSQRHSWPCPLVAPSSSCGITTSGQYPSDLYCNARSPYPHGPQIVYSYHEFMNAEARGRVQDQAQASFEYSQVPQPRRKVHYKANDPRSAVEATDYFMGWERYTGTSSTSGH
ncbi:hypothetical protein BROUX41_002827 [Berkeleyomyces rouxiae]|uniref:uncharacterized protein n=1 Tax=Berkeleyomyces rouxiae TaxID=2035830 RepID=UPI003B82C010